MLRPSFELDRPAGWRNDARHDLDEGRLPCAIVTEKAVDFAGPYSEADVVDRKAMAEGARDMAELH
jgi:hypothetical protein